MANNKPKSIIEEAAIDANMIRETLKANTKEILRDVANEEIDAIVRESLEEAYVEEDVVNEDEMTDDEEVVDVDVDSVEDEAGEVEGSNDYEDEESDVEIEAPISDEPAMDAPMGDEGMSDDEAVMDLTAASDDEVISVYRKLSGEDEIEVVGDEITLNVSEPGEYVIKTNGGTPEESGIGAEPEIGMDAEPEMGMSAEPEMGMSAEPEMGMDAEPEGADYEEEVEDEVVYEIALDEDIIRSATSDIEKSMTGDIETGDIDKVTAPVGNEKDDNWAGDNLDGGFPEDEATSGDGHAEHIMKENDEEDEDIDVDDTSDVIPDMLGEEEVNEDEVVTEDEITEEDVAEGEEMDETKYVGGKVKKVATAHTNQKLEESTQYKSLLAESNNLKKENDEFRKTLKTFRGMLAETVVFNSNLTYVTKLFVEHSITKDEKQTILKRFDEEVSTIKESKKLYKTISNEFKGRTPIKESVNNKIVKETSSSTSKNLNESTVYVDSSTQRIQDLINRVENKNN